jgi:hypothetical protein
MADDVNPTLRHELNEALKVLNPEIRGMRTVVNGGEVSPALRDALVQEILNRERRRDLILVVLDRFDQTNAALVTLRHDGYPALPNVELSSTLLAELTIEETDVEAAVGVFTSEDVLTQIAGDAASITTIDQPLPPDPPSTT